jgi:outer membrane immunogenic protein
MGELRMPKSSIMAMLTISLGWVLWGGYSVSAQRIEKLEVGGDYVYTMTNAPPGKCGCIFMNGGGGWLGYNFGPRMALVAEASSQGASNIEGTVYGLHLVSYLVGPRYSWHPEGSFSRSSEPRSAVSPAVLNRVAPFVQLLLGEAHAQRSFLTPVPSGLPGSANTFALAAGGGVDLDLSPHWALRIVEADYYLTRFANGVNDRQNNTRISAGAVFRFGW